MWRLAGFREVWGLDMRFLGQKRRKKVQLKQTEADPLGDDSQKGNGNSNCEGKGNGNCKGNGRSLRDDKQKDKQQQPATATATATSNSNSRSLRDDKQKDKQQQPATATSYGNGKTSGCRCFTQRGCAQLGIWCRV